MDSALDEDYYDDEILDDNFSQILIGPLVDDVNITAPPIVFSFMGLASPSDALSEKPRQGGPKRAALSKVTASRALKLNNNQLSDYEGLLKLIDVYFISPLVVSWLDLSFNLLIHIGKELLQLQTLQILYLHGNAIAKLKHVEKLNRLDTLRSLTLHGNPIEKLAGYRQTILIMLPQVQKLDFSNVTPSERFVADISRAGNLRRKRRKA